MKLSARHILLDLDGTLLDSYPGLEFSVREAFAAEGLPVDTARLQSLIGPPIRSILDQLQPGLTPSSLDRLEAHFRRSYDGEGWKRTTCFPGAHAALGAARQAGRVLYVVSNKPRHIALTILEAEHLLPTFKEIVTRDSSAPAYAGKAEMIEDLLTRHRLRPQEVLMVGDTSEDAEAARKSGTQFMLMTHGYGYLFPEQFDSSWTACDHFNEWLPWLAEETSA